MLVHIMPKTSRTTLVTYEIEAVYYEDDAINPREYLVKTIWPSGSSMEEFCDDAKEIMDSIEDSLQSAETRARRNEANEAAEKRETVLDIEAASKRLKQTPQNTLLSQANPFIIPI